MAIMKMLPPQVLQAIMANPQQAIQQFMPMILKMMMGGGGAPPGGAPPPQAYSGNAPPQPPAQGAIEPSTQDELDEASNNMGAAKPY